MDKPTVYVVHEVMMHGKPVHDTSPAIEFGKRRVLVRTYGGSSILYRGDGTEVESKANDATFVDEATALIQDGLSEYTRDDYIVLIGSPKLIAIAAAIAADRTDGLLRMLVWQNRSARYDPVEVDGLYGKMDDHETDVCSKAVQPGENHMPESENLSSVDTFPPYYRDLIMFYRECVLSEKYDDPIGETAIRFNRSHHDVYSIVAWAICLCDGLDIRNYGGKFLKSRESFNVPPGVSLSEWLGPEGTAHEIVHSPSATEEENSLLNRILESTKSLGYYGVDDGDDEDEDRTFDKEDLLEILLTAVRMARE